MTDPNPVYASPGGPSYRGPAADMMLRFDPPAGAVWVVTDTDPEQVYIWTDAWTRVDAGGGGASVPINEVVYGTGAGVAGSANLLYVPSTSALTLKDPGGLTLTSSTGSTRTVLLEDEAGVALATVVATAAARTVTVAPKVLSVNDAAGHPIETINGTTRVVLVEDEGGHAIETMTTTAAARSIVIADETGVQLTSTVTKAATRTLVITDAGNIQQAQMQTLTGSSTRTATLFDSTGVSMLQVNQSNAAGNRSITTADENGHTIMLQRTLAADRFVQIEDENVAVITMVNATAANRSATFQDQAGHNVLALSLIAGAGTRIVQVSDSANHVMQTALTMTTERTITNFDTSGAVVQVTSLLTGTATTEYGINPGVGAVRLRIDSTNKITQTLNTANAVTSRLDWASGLMNLGAYLVANLPTSPTATEGAMAYATNALKTGETTGNGTGMPVFWSAKTGGGWFDGAGLAVSA